MVVSDVRVHDWLKNGFQTTYQVHQVQVFSSCLVSVDGVGTFTAAILAPLLTDYCGKELTFEILLTISQA